jgi:hypothetical protein
MIDQSLCKMKIPTNPSSLLKRMTLSSEKEKEKKKEK